MTSRRKQLAALARKKNVMTQTTYNFVQMVRFFKIIFDKNLKEDKEAEPRYPPNTVIPRGGNFDSHLNKAESRCTTK